MQFHLRLGVLLFPGFPDSVAGVMGLAIVVVIVFNAATILDEAKCFECVPLLQAQS